MAVFHAARLDPRPNFLGICSLMRVAQRSFNFKRKVNNAVVAVSVKFRLWFECRSAPDIQWILLVYRKCSIETIGNAQDCHPFYPKNPHFWNLARKDPGNS